MEYIFLKLNNKIDIKNIEYSSDNLKFHSFDNELCEIKDNTIAFMLSEKISLRYLKICIKKEDLKQVNFYIRKFPLLFIAARTDALGERLCSLLNAMYLADRLNCKFGFVWEYPDWWKNRDIKQDQEKQEIISPSICHAKDIFSEKFIYNYSYTGKIKATMESYFWDKKLERKTDNFLKVNYDNDWGFYTSQMYLCNIFTDVDKEEYLNKLSLIFKNIQFSSKYIGIVSMVEKIKKQIDKDFISLHIRGADIIYKDKNWGIFAFMHKAAVLELMVDISLKSKNTSIVIFGDDLNAVKNIKNFLLTKSVDAYSVDDFISRETFLSSTEQAFFEIMLMSKSLKIYGSGKSGFSRAACYIGGVKDNISIYEYYSKEEQYEIIQHHMQNIQSSRMQKVFSTFHLFCLSKELKHSLDIQRKHILKCISLDNDNFIYKVFYVDILLHLKQYKEADEYISTFSKYIQFYLEVVCRKWGNDFLYTSILEMYFKIQGISAFPYLSTITVEIIQKIYLYGLQDRYQAIVASFVTDYLKELTSKTIQLQESKQLITNQTTQIQNLNNTLNKTIKEKDNIINSNINHINQLQSNIQERSTQLNQIQSKLSFQTKYGTAKIRIQNQLSYKLGQTMIINSKNIFGILFMPVYIISTLLSHKQEQKIYQEKIKKDPSLKLPPLENYPDYKEALKFKNHLSYKLGQALIKANKTWYKGGYVKLAFKIRKLKKVKI
ncbi:hypothetical protein LT083_001949 [Campylobacter coli]|nr:hypothetical protein [Campylobacter coli]